MIASSTKSATGASRCSCVPSDQLWTTLLSITSCNANAVYDRLTCQSLQYTNDNRFCLRELQPKTEDRESPWPVVQTPSGPWQWGRHEAHDENFPNNVKNLTPPSHPATVVVTRPIADSSYSNTVSMYHALHVLTPSYSQSISRK